MEPLLSDDDVLGEIVVVKRRLGVVRRRLSNDVSAEVAVAALEHGVRVPEVGARGLSHERVTEPAGNG